MFIGADRQAQFRGLVTGLEAYHEAEDVPEQLERFRQRHGHYPKSDAIYQTRNNTRYCRERGIRMSWAPLGRPKTDAMERKQNAKHVPRLLIQRTLRHKLETARIGVVFKTK